MGIVGYQYCPRVQAGFNSALWCRCDKEWGAVSLSMRLMDTKVTSPLLFLTGTKAMILLRGLKATEDTPLH